MKGCLRTKGTRMLRKRFTKLACLVACAAMLFTLQAPLFAFAEEGSTQPSDAKEAIVASDLTRQSMADLFADGSITAKGVTLAIDEKTNALSVSGGKSKMQATTIAIKKTFDFGDKTVGRFNVSGLAEKGKKITLSFYLDGAADPFFTTRIKSCNSTEGGDKPQEISKDVIPLGITGTHELSIKVTECGSDPSFVLDYIEFAQASIPVVSIDIDESLGTVAQMNESSDHTATCYGSISIDVPTGCTSVMTGKSLEAGINTYDMDYIRGRGNSTWTCNKKPYKFKLSKSKDLLDMGANKHWALMANAFDDSHLRNAMSSQLGFALGMDYTPSMEPVEVIMNGSYLGCYYLSETTRTGESRVNVEDLADDETDPAIISGGYLLSYGNWSLDEDKLNFTTTRTNDLFQVESPDLYASKNQTQFEYIKNYVQQTEDAIYDGLESDTDTESYTELLDVDASIKYYWVEELSSNGDGYTSGSCYLYKHRNGKLCWGPLWDFDLAWGNKNMGTIAAGGFSHNNSLWNDQLFKYKSYSKATQDAWTQVESALNELYKEGGIVDKMADCVRIAAGYDREKWRGKASGFDWDSGAEWESGLDEEGERPKETEEADSEEDSFAVFDNEVQQLRTWVEKRANWIGENLSELNREKTTITLKVDGKAWKTMPGYIGSRIGELPTLNVGKNRVLTGWEYTYTETFEDLLNNMGMTEEEYREDLIRYSELTPEEADAEIARLKEGYETTTEVNSETIVIKNMVLEAVILDCSDIPSVTKIYLPRKTVYGIYAGRGFEETIDLRFSLAPYDAESMPVTITSSNENVVTVVPDDPHSLNIKGPGDAVITIKPAKGVSATVKVHIFTEKEYEEHGEDIPSFPYLDQTSFTLKVGQHRMLPIQGMSEASLYDPMPQFVTSNECVVYVDSNGVMYAIGAGKAVVCMITDDGSIYAANVTVKDSALRVGSVVTYKGLKYKITDMSPTNRTVTCIGPTSKKLKTATIRSKITIRNKKYRVSKISKGAFAKCKSLKSVTIGKYVHIVGSGAFKGCKSLKKVYFKSKVKPKVYKSAFKKTSKKLKFYVPAKQKKYYQIILGKKRVKVSKKL